MSCDDIERLRQAALRDPAQLVRFADALVANGPAPRRRCSVPRGLLKRPDDVAAAAGARARARRRPATSRRRRPCCSTRWRGSRRPATARPARPPRAAAEGRRSRRADSRDDSASCSRRDQLELSAPTEAPRPCCRASARTRGEPAARAPATQRAIAHAAPQRAAVDRDRSHRRPHAGGRSPTAVSPRPRTGSRAPTPPRGRRSRTGRSIPMQSAELLGAAAAEIDDGKLAARAAPSPDQVARCLGRAPRRAPSCGCGSRSVLVAVGIVGG